MSEKTKVVIEVKPESQIQTFKNAIKSQNCGKKIKHKKDKIIIEGVCMTNLRTVYTLAYQHGLQPT